jgi:hypothetical protein
MNVYELGPLTGLSRSVQRRLKQAGLHEAGRWYVSVQLLDDIAVDSAIIIDKFRVGVPYKLNVVGIVSGELAVVEARMNSYVMLICDPTDWVQVKHAAEIERALDNANTLAS